MGFRSSVLQPCPLGEHVEGSWSAEIRQRLDDNAYCGIKRSGIWNDAPGNSFEILTRIRDREVKAAKELDKQHSSVRARLSALGNNGKARHALEATLPWHVGRRKPSNCDWVVGMPKSI